MNLHNNKQLFQQAVRSAEAQLSIPAIYIEKDYWVTFALHALFADSVGEETIFKGGTALSKCFKLIERFSEDIDLVVLRREGESHNKLTNKIRRISQIISNVLPEVEIAGLTQKMGMNRKTAHSYAKIFTGNFGQVRDIIVVEATWLGYYEPYTNRQVSSFVYDMMKEAGQLDLAAEYDMLPFKVKVLEPRRTLCEKIMSLVRFSYTDNPMDDLKKKIRHTYDIHMLLQNKDIRVFFDSPEFDEMLLKVANDDVLSFKNNNDWLHNHPKVSLVFSDVENAWSGLKESYSGNFRDLIYGNFPEEEAILKSLLQVAARLKVVEWSIKF